MGLTRADLQDPKWSEQDKREIAIAIDNYQRNDVWIAQTKLPIAILLTSHPGNRAYLKACVETHKKLGYWICLAYDNYIHPGQETIDYNSVMPHKDVMEDVDTFFMPHYQSWGGVLFPYFWLMKFGLNILSDFEYIYCTNGDFVIEKPEGFESLFKMLDGYDIITSGPNRKGYANTAGFIAKTDILKAIFKHIERYFIPFENYEKYTQEFGNAEARFGRAIEDLGLKLAPVEPPKDDMLKVPGQGTWYDLLGFRHIHAEMNYAYRNRGIPPPLEYLDERFTSGFDMEHIKKYYETKDPTVLETWWAK